MESRLFVPTVESFIRTFSTENLYEWCKDAVEDYNRFSQDDNLDPVEDKEFFEEVGVEPNTTMVLTTPENIPDHCYQMISDILYKYGEDLQGLDEDDEESSDVFNEAMKDVREVLKTNDLIRFKPNN